MKRWAAVKSCRNAADANGMLGSCGVAGELLCCMFAPATSGTLSLPLCDPTWNSTVPRHAVITAYTRPDLYLEYFCYFIEKFRIPLPRCVIVDVTCQSPVLTLLSTADNSDVEYNFGPFFIVQRKGRGVILCRPSSPCSVLITGT